jgi:adenylate kinase
VIRLVMLGPPGAGKGTQAARFARSRQVPHISTGEVLRREREKDPELDRQARATMDAGRLVDDDVVIGIVRRRLAQPDTRDGFVLDGFPRTLMQAEALDHLLDDGVPLVVVDIEVPEETLIERLRARRVCALCGAPATAALTTCGACGGPLIPRSDDDDRVVQERLRVYAEQTQPIVEFYRRRPTFRSVDGDQPQDAVAADISSAVAAVLGVQ